MQTNDRRALIFGISGQDGAYLADILLRRGIEVHGTSRDRESASFSSLRALGILDRIALHSTVLGDFPQFPALASAMAAPFVVPLVPKRHGGRYFYNLVLDVEMLSLSDLDEVEHWLRGELRPAVQGKRNPAGVVGRGLRTLFVRLLGAERRHYEVRSKEFKG